MLRTLLTALLATGALITGVNQTVARPYLEKRGAQITFVASGSAAEEAGLEVGDIIVSVNGTKIQSANHLVQVLKKSGGTAEIVLIDGNGEQTTVTAYPRNGKLGIDMQIVTLADPAPYGGPRPRRK